ncbi:hypothetical protein [Dactylosporangium salmoneum]|uniref:Uncharacterized protein n=1 Tax=Dactylosporangium salmoneum TaxID=53361 RepID=A0ABP5U877_9ACTN
MTAGDAVVLTAPGDTLCHSSIVADQVDLFLFSAACWLPHRIHFDRGFALSEGLPDTPVHGPLQAAWLCQLAEEWAMQHGGHLVASSVRHLASVFPGDPLMAGVAATAVTDHATFLLIDVELSLDRRGEVVTRGTGQIRLPRIGPA